MHGAPASGHFAPQPSRVAGPLHGTPCSSRQRLGSRGGSSWSRLNWAMRLMSAVAPALVAHGRVAGAQDRAAGRQGRLAVEGRAEQPEDLGDPLGLRRAARHAVVDLDDLVERLEQPTQGRQVELALGHRS